MAGTTTSGMRHRRRGSDERTRRRSSAGPAAQPRRRGEPARRAPAVARRRRQRRRARAAGRPLLQAGAPARVRRRSAALMATGQPSTSSPSPTSCAAPACSTRSAAPELLLTLQNATPAISNAGRYAKIVQDTAVLRRLIGVAGEIAEMAYHEPDDVTQGARRGRVRRCSRSPRTASPTPRARSATCCRWSMDHLQETFDRGDTITGTATGLQRPRRDPARASSRRTLNIVGARPAMGKTRLRRSASPPTSPDDHASRCWCSRSRWATPSSPSASCAARRGSTRRSCAPAARRDRLDQDRQGDQPARGPAAPRRQPARHGDGDPRQGPPVKARIGGLGAHRHRLPAADERRHGRREPPARGQRDQPWPEDPRPRARGADHRPQPAQPNPGDPRRQAPDARRPARVAAPSSRTPTS